MWKRYDLTLKDCLYYDGKNHVWTHCNTTTHTETRWNILKKAGRCFLCLSKVNLKKHCRGK